MSSLLQFDGEIRRNQHGRGVVGLQFIRRRKLDEYPYGEDIDPPVPCSICGKDHPQVGVAFRRPRGMFGCWVQFQYNGEMHVPDLSVPIDVEKWPVGTKVLNATENARVWHPRGEK